jgi:uncharacterized protein YjbI with pentapeptide repeats
MKITKSLLKQIIKEVLQKDQEEKLIGMMKSGDIDQFRQARDMAMSLTGDESFVMNLVQNILKDEESDLESFDLSGMDLQNMDFSRAAMNDIDLSDADLRGANLDGAMLNRANLKGADLSTAQNLDNIYFFVPYIYDDNTLWPNGYEPTGKKES